MYHFDYVGKRGGAVFENFNDGAMVILNGKNTFSFNDFLNTFVLIEQFKHPFTITTTEKRKRRLTGGLRKLGYISCVLRQIDFDFGDENAFVYGYYCLGLPNPFRHMEVFKHEQAN